MDVRKPIFDAIRTARNRGFSNLEVLDVDACLDRLGVDRFIDAPEPSWLIEARSLIGQREIAGPAHNGWIAKGWARLGAAWYKDDETPWCGLYVAHCIDAAGLAYPSKGLFARAATWGDWGQPCFPQVGAIGVKKRVGGNHVFFIIGQTPDRRFYKALGGNQKNMVSVIDILKSDVHAVRWPAGVVRSDIPLPVLPAGPVAASEA